MRSDNESSTISVSSNPDWTFDELVAAIFEPYDAEAHQENLIQVEKLIARGYLLRFPVTLYIVKRVTDTPSSGPFTAADEDSCWFYDESGLHQTSISDYRECIEDHETGQSFVNTWVSHYFSDGYRYLNTWRTYRRHGEST